VVGGIIVPAPPVESATPTPASAGPDVIETSQRPPISSLGLQPVPHQESSAGESPVGMDAGSSTGGSGELSPQEIESRIDPALPEPVQDLVYEDIQTKSNQAADWTN
jgi:hypothetical protein